MLSWSWSSRSNSKWLSRTYYLFMYAIFPRQSDGDITSKMQFPSPAAQCHQDRGNLVCSKSNLSKRSTSVQVGSATIHPSDIVRDLGLHLDSELSMKHHVAKVAAVCFYHLRWLRQTRRCVGMEVTIRLALAVVISRLDYCNSLLAGALLAMLGPLQRVQHAAARLIFQLTPRDHSVQVSCSFTG